MDGAAGLGLGSGMKSFGGALLQKRPPSETTPWAHSKYLPAEDQTHYILVARESRQGVDNEIHPQVVGSHVVKRPPEVLKGRSCVIRLLKVIETGLFLVVRFHSTILGFFACEQDE